MKILIVDDEPVIRKYIKKLIEDCGTEYTVIGSVGNGHKALEIIRESPPELVFADITMPKMNGLELLRTIKSKYAQMKVVILTCHSDFEYARMAMNNKADEYILKEELTAENMKNVLETYKKELKKDDNLVIHVKRNNYLQKLIEEEHALFLDTKSMEKYQIYLKDSDFFALAFLNSSENLDEVLSNKKEEFQNQIIFPYQEQYLIYIANLSPKLSQEDGYWMIRQYVQTLREKCGGQIGVSPVYYRLFRIGQAVMEAVDDMEEQFYESASKGIKRRSLSRKEIRLQLKKFRDRISFQDLDKDLTEFKDILHELFHFAKATKGVSVDVLKSMLTILVKSQYKLDDHDESLEKIKCSNSCLELEKNVQDMEKKFVLDQTYSKAINDSLTYIQEHYMEELSLQHMASLAFLNSEYFSRLFKKETGVNFTEYLKRVRIKEARKLVYFTDESIYTIAVRVGMNNPSYFNAVFKKEFGMTPNEMRKRKRSK